MRLGKVFVVREYFRWEINFSRWVLHKTPNKGHPNGFQVRCTNYPNPDPLYFIVLASRE